MSRRSQVRNSFGCLVLTAVACAASGFFAAQLAPRVDLGAISEKARQLLEPPVTIETAPAPPVAHVPPPPVAPPAPPPAPPPPGSEFIQVYFAPTVRNGGTGIDRALVSAIEGAKSSVRAAFYDLDLAPVAQALIGRHRAGLQVAIASDKDYAGRDAIRACIDAGIPVYFDRSGDFMHNKFCIIDDHYVWTGSTNITENCMYKNDNNALYIGSKALAQNYLVEFEEFTQGRFGRPGQHRTPYPQLTVAGVQVESYFAPDDGVERFIIGEINAAQQEIAFMAFSFTSKPIAEAMAARRVAGVRVRGVFEARNMGSEASRDEFLAERRAEVRRDGNPNNLHHKVILIDARTVIAGSYNFSKSANTGNDENLLIIHDPRIAAAYIAEFERVWKAAR